MSWTGITQSVFSLAAQRTRSTYSSIVTFAPFLGWLLCRFCILWCQIFSCFLQFMRKKRRNLYNFMNKYIHLNHQHIRAVYLLYPLPLSLSTFIFLPRIVRILTWLTQSCRYISSYVQTNHNIYPINLVDISTEDGQTSAAARVEACLSWWVSSSSNPVSISPSLLSMSFNLPSLSNFSDRACLCYV